MQSRDLDRIRFVTRHFHDLQGLRYWVPLGLLTLSVGGTTYFDNRSWVLLRIGLLLSAFFLALGARRYYRRTFGEVEPQPLQSMEALSSVSIYSPSGPLSPLWGLQQMPPAARHFLISLGSALAFFVALQVITPPVMINTDESLVQQPWRTLNYVLFFELPGAPDLVWRSGSTLKAAFGQMIYALYGGFFLGVWLWRKRRLSQSYHLALGLLLLGLSALGICLGFLTRANGEAAEALNLFVPAVVHLWVALLLCGSSMILAGLLDHWQLVRVLGRRVED